MLAESNQEAIMKPSPRQRIRMLQEFIARTRRSMDIIESDGGVLPHNDPLIVTWLRARRELKRLQGNPV